MAKLFEYAVFKDDEVDKDGNVVTPATVLVSPTTVLAQNEQQVGMLAARAISEDDMDDLELIQIVVRPF